jgi:RNA polymerase sigma-70 factor (ECF subfamily)
LSQKETAETLGISEGIVEQETMKGMHLISDMVGQVGLQEGGRPARHSKRTGGKKNVND